MQIPRLALLMYEAESSKTRRFCPQVYVGFGTGIKYQ